MPGVHTKPPTSAKLLSAFLYSQKFRLPLLLAKGPGNGYASKESLFVTDKKDLHAGIAYAEMREYIGARNLARSRVVGLIGRGDRSYSINVDRLVCMMVSWTLCMVILSRFVSVALVKWT